MQGKTHPLTHIIPVTASPHSGYVFSHGTYSTSTSTSTIIAIPRHVLSARRRTQRSLAGTLTGVRPHPKMPRPVLSCPQMSPKEGERATRRARAHTHTPHARTHTHTHTHTHTRTRTPHTRTHAHAHTQKYMQTQAHTHTHARTHARRHTHTNTRTHTQTQTGTRTVTHTLRTVSSSQRVLVVWTGLGLQRAGAEEVCRLPRQDKADAYGWLYYLRWICIRGSAG
jgi:hypothetical protein